MPKNSIYFSGKTEKDIRAEPAASLPPERHSVIMVQPPIKAYIIFLIKKQQQGSLLFLFKFTNRREVKKHGAYSVWCLDMGETLSVENELGFGRDIPTLGNSFGSFNQPPRSHYN